MASEASARAGGGATSGASAGAAGAGGGDAGFPCTTDGCEKRGTMCCPTCKKIGAGESYFCTQECFKDFWPKHKGFHKVFKQMKAATMSGSRRQVKEGTSFEGYTFTGPLRPGTVTERLPIDKGIAKPDYADDGVPTSEQAVEHSKVVDVNSNEQIEIMRRVGRLGREVLDLAGAAIRPGVTGDEIDKVVHAACMERGVYPSPMNYCGFPKSVCVSANEVICHGIPDTRPLEDGDIVNLDVTVYGWGHHADLNETYFVGTVDEESQKLVRTAFDCLKAAVELVKPGTMYRELGNAIAKVAKANSCSVVKTYCGHGVHRLFHTAPNIPHYAKNKAVGTMKPGHIFTIEPMINLGTHHDETWPDGWTSVTTDGKRSAQFEHTILVTETGYELLTGRIGVPTMEWDDAATQRPLAAAEGKAEAAKADA